MYSTVNGFVPRTFDEIIGLLRVKFNEEFGAAYTAETFVGSNFYKYCYNVAQTILEQDILTQNIYEHYLDYVANKNLAINTPISSPESLLAKFTAAGLEVGFYQNTVLDAGIIKMAVNLTGTETDYAAIKATIAGILKDNTPAGTAFDGDQTQTLVLSNGQSFVYKFALANRITTKLKCTFTTSVNNTAYVMTADEVKTKLLSNIASEYRIGNNFEPQRYANISSFPFASTVLLQYSIDDGATWLSTVYSATFDEKLIIASADIEVIFS